MFEIRLLVKDGPGEPQLDQGPVQVLPRPLHPEIAIACQVIGKEPQPQLKADHRRRTNHQGPVSRAELITGLFHISGHQGGKQFRDKNHRLGIGMTFAQGIAAGTQAIAQIMQQQAGFDRIQIDQAHRPILPRGKKEVGHLGITVDDPVTQKAAGILQHPGQGTKLLDHPGALPFPYFPLFHLI